MCVDNFCVNLHDIVKNIQNQPSLSVNLIQKCKKNRKKACIFVTGNLHYKM